MAKRNVGGIFGIRAAGNRRERENRWCFSLQKARIRPKNCTSSISALLKANMRVSEGSVQRGNRPPGDVETLKRECLKDDVSAGDDIAGIILDLDCNEERARQLRELLCQEEYAHYKAFASNPCFEVWFVAHFHELRGTYSGSSQVLEDLKRQLPDYDKGRDCYRKLKDHTQEAIERCKAKEKQYKDRNWPSGDCNPRTDVAELVELLTK